MKQTRRKFESAFKTKVVLYNDLRKVPEKTGVVNVNNYYPFGMVMPERGYFGAVEYRFGFQGHEKDNEVKGYGNSYTTEFRQLDTRLGRWITIDPLANKYPNESPYASTGNNPVSFIDSDGRCYTRASNGEYVPCAEPIKSITYETKSEFSDPIITYDYGATKTDDFGYNWTFTQNNTWQLTNGADPSKVNYQYDHIEPTGDASYYEERYKSHIEKYNTRPPDYYLEYGYNNKVLFDKAFSSMSVDGQKVFVEIGLRLQKAMNLGIRNNPSLQGNNEIFKDFTYRTHFPVYKESGIGRLGGNDLLRMISVPKWKDTFGSPEGRSLIKELIPVLFSERPRVEELWDSQKNPGLIQPGEPKW